MSIHEFRKDDGKKVYHFRYPRADNKTWVVQIKNAGDFNDPERCFQSAENLRNWNIEQTRQNLGPKDPVRVNKKGRIQNIDVITHVHGNFY